MSYILRHVLLSVPALARSPHPRPRCLLQRRFEAIQGMHDPNLLGGFASQAPYHADALLQLAMVFAHTGQVCAYGHMPPY